MLQTVEAIINENGEINLLEKVKLSKPRRAIVTILNEDLEDETYINSLLSEGSLDDWNRPDEEEAWAHL